MSSTPSKPGSGLKHQRARFAEFTSLDGRTSHISLEDTEWLFPDDEAVDLAICYFPGKSPRSIAIPENTLLSHNKLAQRGIGIGDEVYSVSLYGFNRKAITKTPIARISNIAMLPLEKAPTEFGETEVYRIEAHSLSGFSGAPVFVRETVRLAEQERSDGPAFYPNALGYLYLLGILHGHAHLGTGPDRVDAGLAYVVPAQRIIELINSDKFRTKMAEHVERELEYRRGTPF